MSELIKIDLPVEEIRAYCEQQPILRLSVIGSEWDDQLRPDTDIGFLVEYIPDARVGYFTMARQEIDLGEIIGWKVDLRTPPELSRYIRQEQMDSARLIYAKES